MPIGHQSFRRRRLPALVLLATLAAVALAASAHDVPPQLSEQALRRTGLTQAELLRRLQAEGATAAIDTTTPPGRTTLPASPRVILPFDIESIATPAVALVETPLPAADAPFGADFFRLDPGVFAPPAFGPVPPNYLLGPGDQVCVDAFGEVEYRLKRVVDRDGGLWADTLPERALIERLDPDLTYRTIEVALAEAMSGALPPLLLQPRDKLRVFSRWDLQDRYRVNLSGEVRTPGEFDFREGLTLGDLILLAGGLRESADVLHAEVSRLRRAAVESRDTAAPPTSTVEVIDVALGADWLQSGGVFALAPHDRVAVRRLPWWELPRTIALQGEVYYPGAYALERPDERLSSVIARAGGLKPTAYAPGARIVRGKDDIGNMALDLDRALRKPGREQDAMIERGDGIRIPARPYTVKVAGAVGFPASIVYEKGHSLGDYVAHAGGYSQQADRWTPHVVYPNGISKQIRRLWGDPGVMPGSTIVVPVKQPETGPARMETLKESASILASAATIYLVIDRTQ
jgi:protein involved in polysaccharide export with SLBB domain